MIFGYDLFEPMRRLNKQFYFNRKNNMRNCNYNFKEKMNDFILSKYIELDTFVYFLFNPIFDKKSRERITSRFGSSIKNLFDINFEGTNVKLIKRKGGLETALV